MIRGLWSHATIGWIVAAALLPPASLLVVTGGIPAFTVLLTGLAAASAWQALFRLSAGIPFSPSGAVIAVAIAALGPEDLALWQVAIGASFGIVLAELVFGGWGRNVVAAPGASLAFLYLAFPALPAPAPEAALALAAGASGLILLASGILSGAFALGIVLIVGDPVASAATPAGRWLYGALAGGLAGLLAAYGPGIAAPQPIIFAALLAQIFAPLTDHLSILAALTAKARRHG